MNVPLLIHTWRTQRTRLALVSIALLIWGFLLPVIYGSYGSQFNAIMESGLFPEEFARFGGGDIFSLPGAIALSFIHPIAICLTSVFAVGFAATAVAGERQRGTLEVALARPVARRRFYVTVLIAAFTFIGVTVTALLAGSITGSFFAGVQAQLAFHALPLLWANGVLLFGSIAAIGLAASVSFDRLGPSVGVTLGTVVVMYVFEVLGTFWPKAERLQPYSLFHYLQPKAILTGGARPLDSFVLTAVIGAAIFWALFVFPRRDLAAPS